MIGKTSEVSPTSEVFELEGQMYPSRAWDVVVVGGAITDFYGAVQRLPEAGETLHSDRFLESPGGMGANQAVASARLGARVAFVGRVGRDARGGALIDQLQAEGVDTSCVRRDPEVATGVATILMDPDGRHQIWVAPGANRRLSPVDVQAAAPAITRTRVLLIQLEIPVPAAGAALQLGRQAGARTLLDPGPRVTPPDDLLRLVDVIRANAREAEALTGVPIRDRATARQAADLLLDRGVGAAAVQVGDEGDLLAWPGGERFLPRIPVHCVDDTGAGDAFSAALAVMLAEGRSLDEAGPFASAAAALASTTLGAMPALPRRDAILVLLARPSE